MNLVKKLFAAVTVFLSLAAMAQAEPVKLISAAQGIGGGCYGMCGSLYGSIRIENIAYHKKVTVHVSINGGTWYDLPARYSHSLEGNYEVWSFYSNTSTRNDTVQFAIRYEVNGQVYWDNNHTYDYNSADGFHIY